MYKILIVEDDRVIADKMKEHLEKWDYEVACVQDFKRVQEEYTAFDPQLVIMDIILPFYNGFHWCTQIRQISSVPILFLSSASDNMNIVMAMNMGGDDFVEKPFDLNVLTAKIQALLRRAYSFTGQLNVLEYRDVILNLNDAAVTFHGERMELTKNDFLCAAYSQVMRPPQQKPVISRRWASPPWRAAQLATWSRSASTCASGTLVTSSLNRVGISLYSFGSPWRK